MSSPGLTLEPSASRPASLPRLGFLGLGWIGLDRMRALQGAGLVEVAALADGYVPSLEKARESAPDAARCSSLDELLGHDLDGVVIATPSALHADQAVACLERGLAVFCQKPLARTAAETERVVAAARSGDRLLGIDFSYRHVAGADEMRRLVRAGEIGDVYLADLTFHNAYGPDKPWFYDPKLAGGGCVIDLGVHLVDLAHWVLGTAERSGLTSALYRDGRRLGTADDTVENTAVASWDAGGTTCRLACSWHLSAGQDCVIEAAFYGTKGAVSLRNVGGSFFDFAVDHRQGTRRRNIADDSRTWSGGAIQAWARRLATDPRFDLEVEGVVETARVIDEVYGR